jgi:dienelactone hydrolase
MRALVRSTFVAALALMCLLGLSRWSTAAAPRGVQVTFQSADPVLKGSVPAMLYVPQGAGPFPAVVLLHPCSGPQPYNYDWAAWLQSLGYVAILPNSVAARHAHTTCGARDVTPGKQAQDGLGALLYLRSRPDVIPKHIAVMGWSHGGAGALVSDDRHFITQFHPKGGGYKAAIALYPGCYGWKANRLAAPLLMLIASDDDYAQPGPCIDRATKLQAAGRKIEWKVYEGAFHGFDTPGPEQVIRLAGGHVAHLRYDASAAADAHTQVQQFLNARLQ